MSEVYVGLALTLSQECCCIIGMLQLVGEQIIQTTLKTFLGSIAAE